LLACGYREHVWQWVLSLLRVRKVAVSQFGVDDLEQPAQSYLSDLEHPFVCEHRKMLGIEKSEHYEWSNDG
jgi:hypothetical protein